MKKTLPYDRADPQVVRIPSADARSTEAALERALAQPGRRFDIWVLEFPTVDDAIALRRRLDEERLTRSVALVALVRELERMAVARATIYAAKAHAARVASVLPPSIPTEALDDEILGVMERQRDAAGLRGVRDKRQEAGAEEQRLRAVEKSMARRAGVLASSTGDALGALGPLDEAALQWERNYLSQALEELHGDVAATRRVLKVKRTRFYELLHKHKLHHLVRRHEPGAAGGNDD